MKKRTSYTTPLVFLAALLISFSIPNLFRSEHSETRVKVSKKSGKLILEPDEDHALVFPSEDRSPVLEISNPLPHEKPVKLDQLSIITNVIGSIATTTLDMIFYNENKRNIEAELNFPLGDGQTITRFAMDINGKLREGVAIEKEKARIAFESTIRQNIDPGLVEMTKGNNFKARVFPVEPKSYKHIIIQYTQELTTDKKHSYYFLPLNFKDKLSTFKMKINVLEQELKPSIISTGNKAIDFQKVKRSFEASFDLKQTYANQSLAIQLPLNKENSNVSTASNDKEGFFYSIVRTKNISQEKQLPKKITVLWDVSGSRIQWDKQIEIDFLKKYLSKIKNTEVELIPFSNDVLEPMFISIKKGNTEELEQKIKHFSYDGGTTISDLPFDKCRGEEILLFSDGLSNLGNPKVKTSGKRIYTIHATGSSDPSNLEQIAIQSNGEYINLLTEDETSAFLKITRNQLHFMGFSANTTLNDYYPKKATPINHEIKISGRIRKQNTTLTALFGFGNQVQYSEKINLNYSKENGYSVKMLEKMWAIKKIQELNHSYKVNKEEITSLGKKYRLVTQNTSLLVLDRLEDYLQHKITPPIEMQKEYFSRLKKQNKDDTSVQKNHIQNVISEFKNQRKWWEKDYKMTEEKKQSEINYAPSGFSSTGENVQREEIALQDVATESQSVTNTTVTLSATNTMATYSANVSTGALNSSTYSWSGSSDQTQKIQKGTVSIQGWDPKSPYLKEIQKVTIDKAYSTYLKIKSKYSNQPSFYLDVAEYFFACKKQKTGLRILTNLSELELENHSLLRILAHRLLQLKQYKPAIQLFKDLVELRNEEPQSHRDLGLAYAEMGENQKAIEKLYDVVKTSYDSRFAGIHLICINEINNIISKSKTRLNTSFIDKQFLKPMPVDIRIVLNWDVDNTDVDLWVTDPNGEKCFYSNPATQIGGRISNDFTQGYGPEEFMIKNAIPGEYKVEADYYGSSSQSIQGKATLQVQFFKQYGSRFEVKQEATRRLDTKKQIIQLGSFRF